MRMCQIIGLQITCLAIALLSMASIHGDFWYSLPILELSFWGLGWSVGFGPRHTPGDPQREGEGE